MKSILTLALVLCVPTLSIGATMNLTSGGSHTVIAHPGGTLSGALTLDTPVAIAAFDGKFHASVSGVISVTGYSVGPVFGFPFFMDLPPWPLDPDSRSVIGGLAWTNLGPGSAVPLSTFTLAFSPNWDGAPIQLTVINQLLSDGAGAPIAVDVAPLNIIPEPTSLLLLGLCTTYLGRRTRERRTP